MTNNQRLYTAANTNVLKNEATEAQYELVTTLFAKLAKSEAGKTAAEDHLESHQLGMEDKLSGKNHPETMEWIRNIEVITKSNEASKAAFMGELKNDLTQRKTSGGKRSGEDPIANQNG